MSQLITHPAGVSEKLSDSVNSKEPKISNKDDVLQAEARILRILNLLRQSNLFSLEEDSEIAPQPSLKVLVSDGEKEFEVAIAEKDISHNVSAQSMLKLFQVFSTENGSEQSDGPARMVAHEGGAK